MEGEEYTIYHDASKNELGCILMQEDKELAYASRPLKPCEKNYPTYDLELIAVVFTLKIWWHYLFGAPCKIYTDYQSLRYIFTRRGSTWGNGIGLSCLRIIICKFNIIQEKQML